ncbi:MAG: hypothetical protein CME04_22680, partial [Gemmatimonadaceae bacterium]|nr:hypothetical protein [Gemmatimonadaceae bacterium]
MTAPPSHHAGAFAAMPIPATLIDAHGVIVDVNDAFLDLARRHNIPLRREDRIGRPIWEFAGEDDPQLGRQAILDFLADGDAERWRRVEQDSTRREGLHDMQLLALRDPSDAVCGALITRQDVTESVVQTRRLDESQQLLTALRTVGHLVLSSLELEVILETISREIVKAGIFRSLALALVDEPSHSIEIVRSYVRAMDSNGELIPGSALQASTNVVGLRYDLDDVNITAEVARTGQLTVTDGRDPRFDKRVPLPTTPRERICYFITREAGQACGGSDLHGQSAATAGRHHGADRGHGAAPRPGGHRHRTCPSLPRNPASGTRGAGRSCRAAGTQRNPADADRRRLEPCRSRPAAGVTRPRQL